MTDKPHQLNFAYERLGDENVVAIRCTRHPNFVAARYSWPSTEELMVIGREHDPDYDWVEHYRWH